MSAPARSDFCSFLLILATCLGGSGLPAADASDEPVVLVTTSDVHFGAGKTPAQQADHQAKAQARPTEIAALIGTALPPVIRAQAGGLETVPRPRGILVAGDLTDGSPDPAVQRRQWEQFATAYPWTGLAAGADRVRIFPCLGNHDLGLVGAVAPLFSAYLDRLGERAEIATRSPAGFHYALHWGRLHVVCLNLCAADTTDPAEPFRFGVKGPGSWNDPQGALGFLRGYLAARVGGSGDLVMIVMHYGFDAFSRDWSWWTKTQRAEFYRSLAPYRIAALVHGHNHLADHYRWPDPKAHADDLAAIYPAGAPPGHRQYEVFSNGGTAWWLILGKDRLTAVHRDPGAWSERLTTVLPLPGPLASEPVLAVKEPRLGEERRESPQVVIRWTAASAPRVTEDQVATGLATLEELLGYYRDRLGWPSPFRSLGSPWKLDVTLDDHVANPNGSGRQDLMSMRIRVANLRTPATLAHELTHCLQFASGGLRDSKYVGWIWESHANWMMHQRLPDQMACWDQLVNCPHLAYGTSRNRYGNWHFLDYLQRHFGNDAVLDLWFRSPRADDPARHATDPFLVLREARGWSQEDLNDQFGSWAGENAGLVSDPDGMVSAWERASAGTPAARHREASLIPVPGDPERYRIPDYWAPQRFGYNKVRLEPLPGTGQVVVDFAGLPPIGRGAETGGWRWLLVARGADGTVRRSTMFRGGQGTGELALRPDDRSLHLVVLAAPVVHEQVAWDQAYATVGRYPWQVRLTGARPAGPPANRGTGAPHPNGGGWVAASAQVDASVYVGPSAQVLDQARVEGAVRIEGSAIVGGRARISGTAIIGDHAYVGDSVAVSGAARIGAATILAGRSTVVTGSAVVATVAYPIHNVSIAGDAHLEGDLELHRDVSGGQWSGFVP